MTPRIILTIEQARTLQRHTRSQDELPAEKRTHRWPYGWSWLLAVDVPSEPDSIADAERMEAGIRMMGMQCSSEQVGLQMNWKRNSNPVRLLVKMFQVQHTKRLPR